MINRFVHGGISTLGRISDALSNETLNVPYGAMYRDQGQYGFPALSVLRHAAYSQAAISPGRTNRRGISPVQTIDISVAV
jgi:hypothetical protein